MPNPCRPPQKRLSQSMTQDKTKPPESEPRAQAESAEAVVPTFPRFSYALQIKEHHLDAFGHVNHAKYLEILEEARWQIISERNYGLDQVIKTQLAPVILELKITYSKELTLRENVLITTEVIDFSKRIGKLRQTIQKADQSIAATAEIAMGVMDLKVRKLVVPNDAWKFALGILELF